MRTLLLSMLLLGACYRPNAQSGAYLCGDNDACPDGLSCECGQCVQHPSQAACSFDISSPMATASKVGLTLKVDEHQPFPISVAAYAKDGSPATGFSGTITLSSTWGDVCVGTDGCLGLPNQVSLQGGAGTATIQLNRETIPPQSVLLRAELAGNVGISNKLRITVTAPLFARDDKPIVPPITALPSTSFGYATQNLGGPSVIKTKSGWSMYFFARLGPSDQPRSTIGVATSTDGKTFSPPNTPLYESDGTAATATGVPSAYDDGSATHVYVGRQVKPPIGFSTISSLTASGSGTAALDPNAPVSLLDMPADCGFCTAVDVPQVVNDPNPSLNGGMPNATLMFFSALQSAITSSMNPVAVVRAYAPDGVNYTVDPAPILQSTRDESILYSPRVIVDGTTYKMFYSVTPAGSGALADLDPCGAPYHVGYATSSDGLYWVRSPTNTGANHVLDVNTTAGAWDTGASVLVGSVVPVDGKDPSTGLMMYYSVFSRQVLTCVTNGIGRAVRR
jgi:hypothetical protein